MPPRQYHQEHPSNEVPSVEFELGELSARVKTVEREVSELRTGQNKMTDHLHQMDRKLDRLVGMQDTIEAHGTKLDEHDAKLKTLATPQDKSAKTDQTVGEFFGEKARAALGLVVTAAFAGGIIWMIYLVAGKFIST